MDPHEVEAELREGVMHLKFCMQLCKMQVDEGRLFMFEHPQRAKSWDTEAIKDVMRLPGVVTVDFDFCSFGMQSNDAR